MKKILSLLLVLTLFFTLAACNKDNPSLSDTDTSTTQTENESTDTNDTQTSETDIDECSSDTETPSNQTSTPTTNINKPTTNSNPTSTHTHTYSAATCSEPKKCKICSAINGKALGHNYENGMCKRCSAKDPNYVRYTIIYNANGGWGETKSSTHIYNESRALSKNGFRKAGYTFAGWSTNQHATSAHYTNTQTVKNLTKTNGDTITLYAIWEKSQTYAFEDLMPLEDSIDNIKFNQTALDSTGKTHNNVAILTYPGGVYKKASESERFTSGQFTKIKGTIIPISSELLEADSQTVIYIYADGEKIYESPEMNKYSSSEAFEVDISGANTIKIRIGDRQYWSPCGELIIENLILVR